MNYAIFMLRKLQVLVLTSQIIIIYPILFVKYERYLKKKKIISW